MNRLAKFTILGTIAGVILAFNMYHADYKLLTAQIGTIVLAAMWLIQRFEAGRKAYFDFSGQKPVLLFFVICMVSFLCSPQKLASWSELYKIGPWIIFGMIIAKKDSEWRPLIINTWMICGGLAALYGILQFLGIDFMKLRLPGGRIVSTFGNATLLAGFLAMTIPVAIDAALKKIENKKVFVAMIAIVIVLLVCLVLTKSRGGILAAMTGIGILYIFRARFFKRNQALIGLLGVVTLGVILLLIPQGRYVISEVVLRKTARVYLWKDAMHMVKVSPLFGVGLGTFGLYFPDFVRKGVLEMHPIEWEFVNHAHCEYLEILIELGIIGLLGFLLVVGNVGRRFLANRETDLGLFSGFAAVLVHNIVIVDLRYSSTGLFFWMIAGIVSARPAIKLQKDEKRPSGKPKFIAVLFIAIAALTAIYFTVRPYAYTYKAEEDKFFSRDVKGIDEEILATKDDFSLGVLYAKKGNFKTAKRYFIKTIKKDPGHAGALNNLGNIAFMQNDAGRARALFHKALKTEPDNVDYLVNFAYACFKVNLMSEAMKAVEKAMIHDPGNQRARLLKRQMTQ